MIKLIFSKITDPINAAVGTLLIRLKPTDVHKCDEMISKLNQKPFPGVKSQSIIIVKKTKSDDQISENNSNKPEKQANSPVKEQDQQEEDLKKKIKLINMAEEFKIFKKERSCAICFERQKVIIFMPCSHLASCVECSVALQTCPICRKKVEATIRTYC
jgi:hypothetical protein